ncbi:hypothetical protein Q0F99_09835 [Rathayibacter oskolensis]|uniref:hypothetical protein n=1 Tax=Rathayibacter oskolensis TaxID=1891671 RepID=UPI00265F796B|nr:hypothetical protein [Rathayibacter oskolensis]WKK73107.1 hypothetical protein Q0F99_09835 [Rathayibacter oskolensis]
MPAVVFIDTSVLCNLIPVPGKDQDADEVRKRMAARLKNDDRFILPITAVIETGNFVAQLSNGGERYATAQRFEEILRLICAGKAPWVLHDVAWNRPFLERFLDGADSGSTFKEHAKSEVGAGDLCILTERDSYRQRTRINAEIWTLDNGLGAHS